jgi:hypothetical protein
MPTLHRIELSQIISDLPNMQELSKAKEVGDYRDALFICALGFEDRCLAVPKLLAEQGYRASISVVCIYGTNIDSNERNRAALSTHLATISGRENVHHVGADEDDLPQKIAEVLQRISGESSAELSVFLDVSVMANKLLMRVLNTLVHTDVTLRIVYAEAKSYRPTRREFRTFLAAARAEEAAGLSGDVADATSSGAADDVAALEEGVSNLVVSAEHPGQQTSSMNDCVILFPSFRPDRSRRVINHVDPSLALLSDPGDQLVWLVGIPHLETSLISRKIIGESML